MRPVRFVLRNFLLAACCGHEIERPASIKHKGNMRFMFVRTNVRAKLTSACVRRCCVARFPSKRSPKVAKRRLSLRQKCKSTRLSESLLRSCTRGRKTRGRNSPSKCCAWYTKRRTSRGENVSRRCRQHSTAAVSYSFSKQAARGETHSNRIK